jgi:hypothetical protein
MALPAATANAFNWQFFQTPRMIEAGVECVAEWEDDKILHYEQEKKEFEEQTDPDPVADCPTVFLTPAAWSFYCIVARSRAHWRHIGPESLLRLATDDTEAFREVVGTFYLPIAVDQLLIEVGEDVMCQPILHLGRGVLTFKNAHFWSLDDLRRAANAWKPLPPAGKDTRPRLMRRILAGQLELLREIIGKKWHLMDDQSRICNPFGQLYRECEFFARTLSAAAKFDDWIEEVDVRAIEVRCQQHEQQKKDELQKQRQVDPEKSKGTKRAAREVIVLEDSDQEEGEETSTAAAAASSSSLSKKQKLVSPPSPSESSSE